MDLRANAIISAVDRFSGPIRAMAGALNSFQSTAQRVSSVADRAGGNLRRLGTSVATPLGFGLAGIIHATQQFEKADLGVQIGSMADSLKKLNEEAGKTTVAFDFERIRVESQKIKENAIAISKEMKVRPTGLLEAGEAAVKMGLYGKQAVTLIRLGGAAWIQDSDITPKRAAEFLGTASLIYDAKNDARGYDAATTKIANDWLAVATMTRSSAGRMEEGLRQFMPLYGQLGTSFADSALLLGGMVEAGLQETEAGTALKSLGTRMLRPTIDGNLAMVTSGFNRADFMEMRGVNMRRAYNRLITFFPGRWSRGGKSALYELLNEGEKSNSFQDPAFQDRLTALVNRETGAKTQEDRDRNQEKILQAILTGGGKVDMFRVIERLGALWAKGNLSDAKLKELGLPTETLGDLHKSGKLTSDKAANFGLSQADLAAIGEGRHLSRYNALFAMLPMIRNWRETLLPTTDQFIAGGNQLYQQSNFGRWEGAMASWDRAMVKLRESEGMSRLIESFERLVSAISSVPPGVVDFFGKTAAAMLTLSAASWVVGGFLSIVGAITGLAGLPLAAIGAGLVAISGGLYALYENWEAVKGWATGLGGKVSSWWTGQTGSDSSGLPPLAKTTDELIRAINQPVQVTGEARIRVDVDVHGLPAGVTATQRGDGSGAVQLRTGTSMGDLAIP